MSVEVLDNGGVGILWQTDDNWVSDNAPGAPDTAQLDNTSVADSTADIGLLTAVDIQSGYTGDVTQFGAVKLTDTFTMVTNATSTYDIDSNDLVVDGDYSVTGTGDGVNHNTPGGRLFLGGDATISNDLNINRYIEPVFIQHSDATPTAAKTHDFDLAIAKSRINDLRVGINQTIRLVNEWQTDVVTWATGTSLTNDTTFRKVHVNGTWITPENATYTADVEDNIELSFPNLTLSPADYGNCLLRFPFANTLIGTWKTTGTALFRTSNMGTLIATISGSLSCKTLQIGNEAQTARGTTLALTGTLIVTGNALVVADDGGAAINLLDMQANSVATITGTLTLEAEAGLNLASTAVLNLTGDLLIDALSPINLVSGSVINLGGNLNIPNGTLIQSFDGIINAGIGGTSFNYSNPDNEHDINLLTLASSCTMTLAGNGYNSGLQGPAATPKANIIGDGQFLINTYVNGNNVIVNGTTDADIEFSFGATPIPAFDYGNATLQHSLNALVNLGGGSGTVMAFRLNVFRSSQNITTLMDFTGSVIGIFTEIRIGDSQVDTRGGKFIHSSTGSLTTQDLDIRTNNGVVETTYERQAGAGGCIITRDLLVATLGKLNFSADSGLISIGRDCIINATAVASFGTTTVDLIGTGDLSNSLFSNTFYRLKCAASGKTTTFKVSGRMEFLEIGPGIVTSDVGAQLTIGISQTGVKVVTVDPLAVFDNSGGTYITMKPRGSGAGINTVDAMDLQGGNFTPQYSSGTIQLLGAIKCAQFKIEAGTVDLNNFNLTCSTDAIINGPLILGTGNLLVGDDFLENLAASTTGLAGSNIIFSGTTAQNMQIATAIPNTDVQVNKTSNTFTMSTGLVCRNLLPTSLNTQAQTIELDPLETYTVESLRTLGSGDGLTTFVSSDPGTQWVLNVSNNSMCFHAAFTDCKVVGGIIEVDKATGGGSEGNLGGNTLSDGVTDGLLFKNINLPTDLDIFMRRISAVTIDRRGEQVPTLKLSPLFTGDDWSLEVNVTDNGAAVDLSAVTSIKAAIISDGNKALIPSTTQDDSTVGANWAIGKVIVVFQSSQTTLIDPAQNAWLEIQIDDGINVYTLPREQLQIVKGVIA